MVVRTNPEEMVSEVPGTHTEMTSDVTRAETGSILMKMMRSIREAVVVVEEVITGEEVTEETLIITESTEEGIRTEGVEVTSLEEPINPEEVATNQGEVIRTTEANLAEGSHLMEEVWTTLDREETGEEASTDHAEVWEEWGECSRKEMTFTPFVSPPIC